MENLHACRLYTCQRRRAMLTMLLVLQEEIIFACRSYYWKLTRVDSYVDFFTISIHNAVADLMRPVSRVKYQDEFEIVLTIGGSYTDNGIASALDINSDDVNAFETVHVHLTHIKPERFTSS